MVELSGPDTPYQHGFNNVVFVIPGIIIVGLSEAHAAFLKSSCCCSLYCRLFVQLSSSIVFTISNYNRMWMSIISGLEMFVSAYAIDNKVVSDNVDNMEENQGGFPEGKLPSPQQLLEMLDSMTGISEEEKNNLREDLMKTIEGRSTDFQQMSANRDLTGQTLILLSLLAIVALIFVFFVYKLFKCLKEREQKKEEKKKNKQSKKKK